MMFSPFCPIHDSKVLLTRRSSLSFWNGPDGPVIHWKCTCGHEGLMDHNSNNIDRVAFNEYGDESFTASTAQLTS